MTPDTNNTAGSDCPAATCSPLTASRVEEIFMDCLFRYGEPTETHIVGEGVMTKAGFHPERLAGHKDEIRSMLHQLSDDFLEDKGGGMSFLNACVTRDGDQWGEHCNIDQLLALGAATGQAKVLMPREMWSMFPGGMPYFSVAA